MNVLTISVEEWNAKNAEIEFLRAEAADRTKKVECLWALSDARGAEIATLRQRIAELEDPHYLKGLQNENEQLQRRLEAAVEHVEAADREVAKLTEDRATLTKLLEAASYHVEGEGDMTLLTLICDAIGSPKP